MSGTDEQCECPLCMEPLEIDDINFFPCTCGYQICRFCWHRIRTDENGLCPACRKAYPEDPAKFNPLTEDELQRIKKERRQKDLQRKQKAAENRKHLANVRVVQRNLVFVVGLSQRLAETEVLKKHEYFGKFGKIHKVVINQSTSYAGAQGPSASAYVTYNKPDDALKAILAVNNVHIDGRTLKASLGTTKYCSHFLRGTQCPKTDCMYLHELGEEAASFTKEEMQVGKHQEYEQKLLEQYMNSQNTANNHQNANNKIASTSRKKTSSPPTLIQPSQSPPQTTPMPPSPPQLQSMHGSPPLQQQVPLNTANKEAWPSLQSGGGPSLQSGGGSSLQGDGNGRPVLTNGTSTVHTPEKASTDKPDHNRTPGKHRPAEADIQQRAHNSFTSTVPECSIPSTVGNTSPRQPQSAHSIISSLGNKRKSLGLENPDSLSLFSSINGYHGNRNPKPPVQTTEVADVPCTEIPDSFPVNSTTDWQAAFGFGQTTNSTNKDWQDDDLGFDPLEESSRGLADLLEKENGQKHVSFSNSYESRPFQPHSRPLHNNGLSQNLPPGFSLSHIQQNSSSQSSQAAPAVPLSQTDVLSSRMLGFVNPPLHSGYPDMFPDLSLLTANKDHLQQQQHQHNPQNDAYNMKDWQDGLRALLPNINISFGGNSQQANNLDTRPNSQHNSAQIKADKSPPATNPNSWMSYDSAILTSASLSDDSSLPDPHWLKSINQLTEMDTNSHRLPFVQQFPVRNTVWPPQTHNPPPGFQTHIRPSLQTADPHKLTEGLQ